MSPLYTVLMLLLVAPMEALVVGTAPRTGLVRASAARMDTPPPPGKGSRLGGTVDQDGKSNVWAVEPQVKVEKTDKGLLQFAPIAAVAVAAVLSVPLLPILFASNPDQGEQRESFFFRARSSHRKPFADLFHSAVLCAAEIYYGELLLLYLRMLRCGEVLVRSVGRVGWVHCAAPPRLYSW